jgi:hypothetical protein
MHRHQMIVVLVVAMAGAVTASLMAANPPDERMTFRAELTGEQEVPVVATSATGDAVFRLSYDGQTLRYKLTVARLDEPTAAHIHLAARGRNGPPVVTLYDGTQAREPAIGRFSGTLARGAITADTFTGPLARRPMRELMLEIRGGGAYVNVHTKAHPDGAIRGQIE